jgi:hypothetical protein
MRFTYTTQNETHQKKYLFADSKATNQQLHLLEQRCDEPMQ